MYARMIGALEARAARPAEPNASRFRKSCLYVVPRGIAIDSLADGVLPAGIVSAQEHCLTSDVTRARACDWQSHRRCRRTGCRRSCRRTIARLRNVRGCLVRYFKGPADLIYTSQGKDVLITDVPRAVIDILRMVCPEMLVVIDK